MKNRNRFSPLWIACIFIFMVSCNKATDTEKATNKNNGTKIVETGELAAIDSRTFILQRYGDYWHKMKVIGLLKHGTAVKAGDSIIQLDPSEIKKFILEKEAQLETQMAVLTKMKVNQENKRQDFDSRIKSENATFDLNKLELESARFESDRIRKVKELQFQQAKISIAKVKRQMQLSKIIEACELRILQIQTNQLKNELKNAIRIIPQLTIRTPIQGIFQIGVNEQNGQLIKLGDDIYAGNKLGSVPDLTWMKVKTVVSENDFLRVKMGQKVIVRLDALPKVDFPAEITFVGKLCHLKDNKTRKKVFDVEVKILKSDERLKPGMTVSCEFIDKD